MEKPLIILGTGGSAYDVLDIVEAINRAAPGTWHVAGFLDDARPVGSRHLDLPILGRLSDALRFAEGHLFINVIGSDTSFRRRPQIIAGTGLPDHRFAKLIHPQASVSSRATLGRGVYAGPGVSVGGAVAIGDHVSLSPGVVVGHDTTIDDYATLAPGAIVSGLCHIGRSSYIGAGAAVRQRVHVGEEALLGMAAVVLQDVAPRTTVVGNPARVLDRQEDGPAARAQLAEVAR
jgi:sugar O-acyltransferase (sialic acid O-acetyltransferase NeuD family)